jgi:hypothetical protein
VPHFQPSLGPWTPILLVAAALLISPPAAAQQSLSVAAGCSGKDVEPFHIDLTLLQADYKVMVTDYEIEPDLIIRLVGHPSLADLILADDLPASDRVVCRSPTRYRATTLYVARFVPQPDITIALNRRDRLADYTLFVDSKVFTAEQAAALFAVLWRRDWRE